MLATLACPVPRTYVEPYWVADILLLVLVWIAIWMWRPHRVAPHLGVAALILPVTATFFTLLQAYVPVDEGWAMLVLVMCLAATIIVYGMMMRDELVRFASFVFPRARVHRRRRTS